VPTLRPLLLVVFALPAGCSVLDRPSAPPAPPRHTDSPPATARLATAALVPTPISSPGAGDVLGSIDGKPLTRADLGDFVLRYEPERAAQTLDRMLEAAVVTAEAARESVVVPQAQLDAQVDAWLEERRRDARVQYGEDFEHVLRELYGRGLDDWRADAAALARIALLRERLVRLDQVREDGVEVRVLVLPDEAAARRAATSLREGADVTLYAQRAGISPPTAPATFAKGEIPDKDLEALLFAAKDGEVPDPVPFEAAAGGRRWQVFKVVRAWKADLRPWPEIASAIEQSLATAPVAEEELRRWRRRAFARHAVVAAGGDRAPR
jgi:hypothetical protein